MNVKRPWVVTAATLALAGFGSAGLAIASDDIRLNDQKQAPLVQLTGDDGGSLNSGVGAIDGSPESADSPGASPFESANSGSDSPGDAGWVDHSPESADSPGTSPYDSAGSGADSPGDAGHAPAAPVAPPAGAGDSSGSADSPAPAPAKKRWVDHSGDSSGGSADSSG